MSKLSDFKMAMGNLSEDDKERAVWPSLLVATDTYKSKRYFVVALGWWKWGIRVGFSYE